MRIRHVPIAASELALRGPGTARAWLGLLVALAFSSLTWAAEAEPSAQDRERARSLLDLGDQRVIAKDYEAALKAYQGADALMGVPTTGVEVGRTLEKLGRLVEARDALLGVTRLPRKPSEPGAFTAARATAERLAAEIAPRIPSLTLSVSGLPAGATPALTLDGAELKSDLVGLPLKLNPGKHELTGRAPGFSAAPRTVELAERDAQTLTLEFVTEASSVPPPPAAPRPTTAAPAEPRPRTWMWVGFGLGAAGVATGTVAGLISLGRAGDAKDHCSNDVCSSAATPDIDASKTWANVSNVGFAVGVLGVGVGVWQLLATAQPSESTEKKRESAGLVLTPVLGANQVGISGSFF